MGEDGVDFGAAFFDSAAIADEADGAVRVEAIELELGDELAGRVVGV